MAAAEILRSRLALVGPGRAGRAFARSWLDAGGKIASLIVRGRGAGFDERIGADVVHAIDAPRFAAVDVLVLAVPDDAIRPVAQALADRLAPRYAFHLSGAVGSIALSAFAGKGAAVASLHPVRPFTGASEEDWRGAFVAVEGDAAAAQFGERVAAALGAHPYGLAAGDRGLYHAAATLAAGGTAAVVSIAVRAWVAAGIPEDIARETLAGLASRATAAVAARPFAEAFTGAIARRDAGTVRAHVAALANDSRALALYRALAEEILARTDGAGREAEIRSILAAEKPPA
jgi:predicted short-subunit dehydrogenase-like oxidoreductase (DUF2520 family)